jgi:MoaA/NifB/PqqE/SkfB family radical SAM enzyme
VIVVWRVTSRCNMGCGFCAYARDLPIARRSIDPDVVRRFVRILSQYQETSGDQTLLSWLGGEPFLWKPLAQVSRYVTQKCHLKLSATTNGLALLAEHTQRLIVESFDELTISIDGPAWFHDRVRASPGAFARIKEGIQRLRAARRERATPLKLRINTVLMCDNIGLFEDMCCEIADWGIDEITFNQLGGNDRPQFHAQHKLTSANIDNLAGTLPRLRLQLATKSVRLMGGEQYLRRMAVSAAGGHLPVADCAPARSFLFVDEHGFVAPCSFTIPTHAMHVSEIQSLADFGMLSSRYAAELQQRRSSWCEDCPSTRVFDKYAA